MKNKNKVKNNENLDLIKVIVFIAPVLSGLLSMWSIFLIEIVCLIGIIYKCSKNKKIILPKGKEVALILVYCFSFLIVEFWAVDKGMNIFAFFKNLLIPLFMLLYLQYDYENNTKIIELIPASAVFTVLFSLFAMTVDFEYIFNTNRFQGIFGYANSFGLFLLLGIVVTLNKHKFNTKDFISLFILYTAILFTNSRAIIILTAASTLFMFIINKNNWKIILASLFSFIILFVLISQIEFVGKRVDSEMVESSEFITRLLYYNDAIELIKQNSFGYGYDGWYYKQVEMQTGVYDTKYVHNSLLQIALDTGVIPTLCLIVLVYFTFFNKKQNAINRILLVLIVGHSLIDIDLEYMYFIVLFITMIDYKTFEFNQINFVRIPAIVLSIFYSLLFLSCIYFESGNYENAYMLVWFNSDALEEELYTTNSEKKQLEMARRILKYNKNISGAYEALINDAVKKEKYNDAVLYEEKRLQLNKYSMNNYILYANVLGKAYEYYEKTDSELALVYKEKILEIDDRIENVIASTNPLCYQTAHKPNLAIPDELSDFIKEYE